MRRVRAALVRSGFFAIGAIYVAMGVVSVRVAALGARDRENGVVGALRFLLDRPHGAWVLGAVVAGLAGIALAQLTRAAHGPGGAWTRAGLAADGLGYAVLSWSGARLLFHAAASSGGIGLEREGVSWLLSESWGAAILGLVGAGIAAGGLWEAAQGVAGRLPLRRDLLPRRVARALWAVSRFGLVARGATLAALGYSLFRAAEDLDPAAVRTIGGTLDALARARLGPAFLVVVAAGLAAYGVYMWALALLRRRV